MSRLDQSEFEVILERARSGLEEMAKSSGFETASEFEAAVSTILSSLPELVGRSHSYDPGSQNFPDIVIDDIYGVEVKFKKDAKEKGGDKWKEVANSVLEGSRHPSVEHIYVIFCKMTGVPEVRVKDYGNAIYHVRTSHLPRFQISMEDEPSLFESEDGIPIPYSEFRTLDDQEKMAYVKAYARRRHPDDWLWWVDDEQGQTEDSELVIRNYTALSKDEKRRLSAEALILCPECMSGGLGGQNNAKSQSYAKIGSYWLRAHSVYSGNIRDALSAGSMVDPCDDGNRMRCLVRHTIPFILEALQSIPDTVFLEFWGVAAKPETRLDMWLALADANARGWNPSTDLDWP